MKNGKRTFRNVMFVAGMIFGYRAAKKRFKKKIYIEVDNRNRN